MCGCGGSTAPAAPAPLLAPSPALVGVTSQRILTAPAVEAAPAREFLAADPFPWWLAFLIIGGAIALGSKPR